MESSEEEDEKEPVRQRIHAAVSGPSRKVDAVTRSLGISSARTDRGNRNQTHELGQWLQESQLDGFNRWVPEGSDMCLSASDFPRAITAAPNWVQKKPQETDARDGPPEEDDDVAGLPDWSPRQPCSHEPAISTDATKAWQKAAKKAVEGLQRDEKEKQKTEDGMASVKTLMFFESASTMQSKVDIICAKYDRVNRSKVMDGKRRPDFIGDIEHLTEHWTDVVYDTMQNSLMMGHAQLHQRNVDLAEAERRVHERAADKQLKQDRDNIVAQIKLNHSTMESAKATCEQSVMTAKKQLELYRQEIQSYTERHESNIRGHAQYDEEMRDLMRRQNQMKQYIDEYEERKKERAFRLKQEAEKLRQELEVENRALVRLDRVYQDDNSRIKEIQTKLIARISNKLLMNKEPFLKAHLQRMLRKKRYFDKAFMLRKVSAEKEIEDLKKTLGEKKKVLQEEKATQNISDLRKLALQAKLVCMEFRLRNHELTKDGEISKAATIEKKVWKRKLDPPLGLLPMLAKELDHQRSWLMAKGMRFELDAKSLKSGYVMGPVTPLPLVNKIAGSAMNNREKMLKAIQLMKRQMEFHERAQSQAANSIMSRVTVRRDEREKTAAAKAMAMAVTEIREKISETVSRVLYREYDEQLHGSDSESDAPSEPGEDGKVKRPLPKVLPVMHVTLQMKNLSRLETQIGRLARNWSRWQEKHSDKTFMDELSQKFAEKIADVKECLKLASASTHWLSGASLQAAALFTDIVWKDLKWLVSLVGQLEERYGALRAVRRFLKQMESQPDSFELAREKASMFLDDLEQIADEEAVDSAEIWMLRLQQGLRKRLDLVKETLDVYSHYLSQKETPAEGKKQGPELRYIHAGIDTMVWVLTSREVKSAKAQERLTVAELAGLLHLSARRLLKDAMPDAFRAVCMCMEALNQDVIQNMLTEFERGPGNAPEELLELEEEEEEGKDGPNSALQQEEESHASKEQRSSNLLTSVVNRSAEQEASDESSSRLLSGDKLRLFGSPEELATSASSRPTSEGWLSTPGQSLEPPSTASSASFANPSKHSRPNSQLGATFTDSFVGEDGFLTPTQDRANTKTPQSGDSSQPETEAPDSHSNSLDTQRRNARYKVATYVALKKKGELPNIDEFPAVSPPGQASITESQDVLCAQTEQFVQLLQTAEAKHSGGEWERKQVTIDNARAMKQQHEEDEMQPQEETTQKVVCPSFKKLARMAKMVSVIDDLYNWRKQLAEELGKLAADEEQQAQEETELRRQLDDAQNEDQSVQIAQKIASLGTLRQNSFRRRDEIDIEMEEIRREQLRQQEEEAQALEQSRQQDEIAVAAYVLRISQRSVTAAEGRRLTTDRDHDGADSPTRRVSHVVNVIVQNKPNEIEVAPAPSQKRTTKRFSSTARGSLLTRGSISTAGSPLIRGSISTAKQKRISNVDESFGRMLSCSDSSDEFFGDDFIVAAAAPKPPLDRRKSVFHNLQKPQKRVATTQRSSATQQGSSVLLPELDLTVHQTGVQQRDHPEDQETPQSQGATAPSPALPQRARRSLVNPSKQTPRASVAAHRGSIDAPAPDKPRSSHASRVDVSAIEDAVVPKTTVDPTKTLKKQHQGTQGRFNANHWKSSSRVAQGVGGFIPGTGDHPLHGGQEAAASRLLVEDETPMTRKQEVELLMGMSLSVAAPTAQEQMGIVLAHGEQKFLDGVLSFPTQCVIPESEQRKTAERENLDVSPKRNLYVGMDAARVAEKSARGFPTQCVIPESEQRKTAERESLDVSPKRNLYVGMDAARVAEKSARDVQDSERITVERLLPTVHNMRYLPRQHDEELQSKMTGVTRGDASGDERKALPRRKAACARKIQIHEDPREIMQKDILLTTHSKGLGKSSAPDMPRHLEVWKEGDPVQVRDETNLAFHSFMQEEGCRKVAEIGEGPELIVDRLKDALVTPQDSLMETHRTTAELSTDQDRVFISQEDSLLHGGDSLMTLSSGPSFFNNLRQDTPKEGSERENGLTAASLPKLVEVRQTGVGDPTAASFVDKNVSWSASAVQGVRVALRSEQQHAPREQQSEAGTRAPSMQPLSSAPGLRLPLPLRGLVSTSEAALISKRGSAPGSPGGWPNSLGKHLGHTAPIKPGIVLQTWPDKSRRPATSDDHPSPRRHMMGVGLVNRIV